MYRCILLAIPMLALLGCESVPPVDPRLEGPRGTVSAFVFTSVDCPVANAMAPQMRRTFDMARALGVRTYLVYPREDLDADEIGAHAIDYQLDATVLADPDKHLVEQLGATVTPEGVVIEYVADDRYEVRYRGRLSDLYPSIGNRRDEARTHEFREAIRAVCDRQPVSSPWLPAIGCMIERAP